MHTRSWQSRIVASLLVAVPMVLVAEPGIAQERTPTPLLGAYYYPWYRGAKAEGEIGWMKRALRGRLQPQQLPRLGVYDSEDAQVIGDHIAQSRRAGIDFWAVSWWGRGKSERAFRSAILKHPDAEKLKYAVLYESTGRLGPSSEPDYSELVADFDDLAEEYFDHPNYLRIDDRPVVFIYLTRVYFRGRGLEALAELRKKHPNLWLVGDEVFGPRCHERDVKLWDAITAYDVYGQSLQHDGGTQASLDRLRVNYENAKKIANESGKAFIPAISPGFNDRAVRDGHVGLGRYFTDKQGSKEGDVFREMIRQIAVPLADARAQRMIMVTSFNEWYEDTQIEATAGKSGTTSRDDSDSQRHYTQGQNYSDYGTLYLDILREELKPAKTPRIGR